MIERSIAPAFKQVEHIELIKAEQYSLDNGVNLFVINAGTQDLVRVELLFNNVNWNLSRPLQAYSVNSMLVEGTSKYTALEIAERVDYYGAFLQTDFNFDNSAVTLYTLTKHLRSTLAVVKDVVTDSVFPEEELETFKRNQKQKLSVNLEKNDYISRRVFNQALFGNTIYGYSAGFEDYDKLQRDDLVSYFNLAYRPNNCTIVVSGKVDDGTISIINEFFGRDWDKGVDLNANLFSFTVKDGTEHYVERPEALQSAIRIGKISVTRNHPDFPALQVLNTVLGGYFGSRLMANIREDKGYTYGIGSALISLQNAGYFFIASEVGAQVCSSAVAEIEKEINLLRTELIQPDELALVKNYMLGSFLGGLENAFSHADKFKNIYFSGLDYDYYTRYIQTVKSVTAEQLMELANFYLDFNSCEKVIVGKK
ncbi:pitrilysin family protein [Pedobacter sp. SYSU D00535]|uniref:M16 family metallopeptidase n=1 Tax=Pedobacter sp. SYSU D00535 TaxID=2810308 RepID=UPI001A972F65|nr:pitrilysin family protein [Pedobacter sp. SYSU D00535]